MNFARTLIRLLRQEMMYVLALLLLAETALSTEETAQTWWVNTRRNCGHLGLDEDLVTRVEVRTACLAKLGLDRDASSTDARRAYISKALELHPDRNIAASQEQLSINNAALLAISECHAWLNNPDNIAFSPAKRSKLTHSATAWRGTVFKMMPSVHGSLA